MIISDLIRTLNITLGFHRRFIAYHLVRLDNDNNFYIALGSKGYNGLITTQCFFKGGANEIQQLVETVVLLINKYHFVDTKYDRIIYCLSKYRFSYFINLFNFKPNIMENVYNHKFSCKRISYKEWDDYKNIFQKFQIVNIVNVKKADKPRDPNLRIRTPQLQNEQNAVVVKTTSTKLNDKPKPFKPNFPQHYFKRKKKKGELELM